MGRQSSRDTAKRATAPPPIKAEIRRGTDADGNEITLLVDPISLAALAARRAADGFVEEPAGRVALPVDGAAPGADDDSAVQPLHGSRVKLPNADFLPSDQLIHLFDNAYCDPDLTATWRREKGPVFIRITKPSGMPRLHEILRPAGASDRNPRDETIYRISWSDRDDVGILEVTAAALHDGSCWERWAGLGIEKRGDINFYARVVQLQAQIFKKNVPNRQLPRHTGWIQWPDKRGYQYILSDGRAVTCDGVIEGRISGYDFGRPREWRRFVPPTETPDENAISGLFGDLHEIDKKGRLSLEAAYAVRSLVGEFGPLQTLVLGIGERRSGKTSAANFARGITGPCLPGPRGGKPDGKFNDTTASAEHAQASFHDMPVLIDDARKHRGAGDIVETARTIDRFISAVYDQSPIRRRRGYKGGQQQDNYVRCGLIITAEESVRGYIDDSRLLRAIVLPFALGEIDHVGLRADWRRRQAALTASGYAILRAVHRALQAGITPDQLGDEITEAEEVFTSWIVESGRAAATALADEDLWSMAGPYAALMTGALLIDRACGGEAAVNAIASYILPSLAVQAEFIQGGGGSGIDREFVDGARRWLFSRHGGYLRGLEKGEEFFDIAIERGYAPDRGGDAWAVTRVGTRLAGKWDGIDCLLPKVFFDASQDYAQHLGKDFPYTPQTYPRALAKLGMLEGQGDRNEAKVRIDGENAWVLRLKESFSGNSGSSGSTRDLHKKNQELSPLPLPDFKGLLSTIAGADFIPKFQSVTAPAPAAPAIFGEHAYIAANDPGEPPAWLYDAPPPAGEGDYWGERFDGREQVQEPPETPSPAAPEPATEEGADQSAGNSRNEKARSTGSARALAATPAARAPQRLAVIDVGAVHIVEDVSKAPRTVAGGPTSWRDLLPFAQLSGISLLWVTPQWRETAGLPLKLTGLPNDRNWKPHKGMPHPIASDLAEGWRPKRTLGYFYPYAEFINDADLEIEIAAPGLGLGAPALEAAPALLMADTLRLLRQTTRFWPRVHLNAIGPLMLRQMHRGPGTLNLRASQAAADCPAPMRKPNLVIDAPHLRPLTADEIAVALWIHGYDANRQYGTAMASLPLGFGVPERTTGNIRFDRHSAGYWRARVSRPPGLADGLPHPCKMQPGHRPEIEFSWYVTPTLDLAEQLEAKIEIVEAHLFPETHQPLQPLYQRLNAAAAALIAAAGDPAPRVADAPTVTEYVPGSARLALALVKQIPRSGIGNFDARTRRGADQPYDLYRPDWRHFVIAKARANFLRALHRAGLVPIGIETDSFYIVSPHADPVVAAGDLKLSPQGGHFKVKWSAPIASLPRGFRGKRAPSMADLRALKAAGKEVD